MTFKACASLLQTGATLLIGLLLSGCAVTTSLWDENKVQAPKQVRGLTAGLPAQVYFNGMDGYFDVDVELDTWRRTGLFSTVTRAQNDEPLKSGVFIRTGCERGSTRSNGEFLGAMLWLMTLGMFPAGAMITPVDCKLALYQDAVMVAETRAAIEYKTLGASWFLIPSMINADKQRVVFQQESAAIRVNNLLNAAAK